MFTHNFIALIASLDAAPADTHLDAWLRPIRGGLADAVLAAPPTAPPRSVSRPRPSLAQRMTTRSLNAMFGLSLSDGWSVPIAVRADVLRHLRLTSRGDEIVTELICRLAQWGAKLREIACDSQLPPRRAGLLRNLLRAARCRAWDTQFTTHAGFYILTAVAQADRYNRWIVDQVRPFLGRRVLEAGAGIGNLSQLFDDCERLVLADREEVYLDRLEQRFAHDERVRVMPVDLTSCEEVEACAAERIDTIFCSNVLEHLEPDEQVLRSFAEALQPGGHRILVVPAGERLYTGIDAALGHFRR
ncbi:MAG: class I SAM-dependent methyltransferase [Planctomycetia bacterium]|nr:class I SAM-dependent methyltransferase [Planctomycetia bacterium]